MTFTEDLTARAAHFIERRTSRRGFIGRTAVVGSALTVAAPTYVLRPGTAYAAVTRLSCSDCGSGLCCDGYTEFCCHLNDDGANECPPGTLLAGWWKVDNSDFCFGTARYYMDCNKASPGCSCGSSGTCQDDRSQCGCVSCDARKDGCTVFRYGNCHNEVRCVGPIMCRLVTCTKPWEIEPTCSQVPRTDEQTRHHHRPCLERDPTPRELAFVRALYPDFLGRPSDSTGETYWGNQMVRGAHLEDGVAGIIAAAFGFTDEYYGFVVDERYRAAFGRDPEPDGRTHWVGRLRDGMTPQEMAVEFLASKEFYDKAERNDRTFIERLYEKVLGRPPGDRETEYWLQAMGHAPPEGQPPPEDPPPQDPAPEQPGEEQAAKDEQPPQDQPGDGAAEPSPEPQPQVLTRRDVAGQIYGSEESRRRRVQSLYRQLLGRDAEKKGRDHWVSVLATSEDITLAIYLASSEEYSDRAETRFPEEEPDSTVPPRPEVLQ